MIHKTSITVGNNEVPWLVPDDFICSILITNWTRQCTYHLFLSFFMTEGWVFSDHMEILHDMCVPC